MTLPSFLFGFLISSLYGAVFHLWRGGGPGRLSLYILLAWAGFWSGHFLAGTLGWTFWSIGPLHLGGATAMTLLFLAGGYWLSQVKVEPREKEIPPRL